MCMVFIKSVVTIKGGSVVNITIILVSSVQKNNFFPMRRGGEIGEIFSLPIFEATQ